MRPLLLDTCAALWLAADAPLAQGARDAIARAHAAGLPLQISPVTAWEIGLMARQGRFRSPLSPHRWFAQFSETDGICVCALDAKILMDASFLPGDFPGGPAARILVATAREYGFTLVTRDAPLLAYAGEGHLAAIPC